MDDRDAQHLGLLSTFHYVAAGLNAVCWGIFPIFHVVMGLSFRHLPEGLPVRPGQQPPPPQFVQMFEMMGTLFALMGIGLVVAGWTLAVLHLLTGNYLRQRRRLQFCQVVSAISCADMPLGTVLGVFTLVVLSRPSVRAAFKGVPA